MPSALWKVGNSALASNAPAVPYKFRNGSGSLAILAAILRALRQQICRNGIPITFGFIYGFDLRQTAQAVVAHHKAGSNSSTARRRIALYVCEYAARSRQKTRMEGQCVGPAGAVDCFVTCAGGIPGTTPGVYPPGARPKPWAASRRPSFSISRMSRADYRPPNCSAKTKHEGSRPSGDDTS